MAMDRKPGKAALASLALACVVAFYMPGTFLRKIESLAGMSDKVTTSWNNGTDEDQEYTGAERVYYWKVAKQIMEEHPFTGIGWGNFADEFARREGLSEGIVAHSTWFQVGAEAGMTGLAAFSAMIAGAIGYSFMAWRRFRRTGDTWGEMHSRVLLTGLLAYCVGGTFISREYSELLFLYIAMTAVIAEQSLLGATTSPATSPALNCLVRNPQ
ncbi:Membrane protein SypL involved in exopolysaccharide production [Desulfovibrio sp. DV]|nr:Membrane protein SypL involved in exopolysaccharide production [Desulfovibrio sp. DV]